MRSTLIKAIWVLFAALFLSAQGVSQAHAVEELLDDHHHDCLICDAALATAEQAVIEPPLHVATPFKPVSTAIWTRRPQAEYLHGFNGRAPPPRGPPTL